MIEASFSAFVFSVYLRSLSPSIAGGDAGEVVAEACHLGVAHPPGYPLFILLNHVVTKKMEFLGGSEAYRANMLAALFNAAACLFIVNATRDVSTMCFKAQTNAWTARICGCLAGGLWALSPLVWQYSVTAEVFAMNNFFAAALIALAARYAVSPDPLRWAAAGALATGLGLCNQHTLLLLALPLTAWVLATLFALPAPAPAAAAAAAPSSESSKGASKGDMYLKRPRLVFLGLAALFFLGLSPYAYLAASMRLAPRPGSWGDTATLRGFFHHLRRADYGSFQLYSGDRKKDAEGLRARLVAWAWDLWHRQGPGGQSSRPAAAAAAPWARHLWPVLALAGALRLLLAAARGGGGGGGGGTEKDNCSKALLKEASPSHKATKSKKPLKRAKNRKQGPSISDKDELPELVDWRQRTFGPMLLFSLAFYLVVFHSLSNLPLKVPILYGVHARFWMQPNQLAALAAGVGAAGLFSAAGSIFKGTGNIFAGCFCAMVCYLQVTSWFWLNDQSESMWLENYAKGLLAAVPPNSIVLSNYDQQWTSLRYLTVCEGFRKEDNITVLHLSMMTYGWWETKRELYRDRGVAFPNRHYGARADPTAFTFTDFVEANYDQFPGGIYLGGKLTTPDPEFDWGHLLVPFGFLDRALRRGDPLSGAEGILGWHRRTRKIWKEIFKLFPPLPDEDKYSEETWEWTVAREFYDHLCDRATYLLEQVIEYGPGKKYTLKLLVEAAWWLEHIALVDKRFPVAHLKNTGLAYMNLVRTKEFDDKVPFPANHTAGLWWPNITIEGWPTGPGWKEWASTRFVHYWQRFVDHPESQYDGQYATVKAILDQVLGAAAQKRQG